MKSLLHLHSQNALVATLPVSDAAAGVAQRRVVRSHTDKKNEQMLEGIKVMKNHMKPLGCTCGDWETGFVCVYVLFCCLAFCFHLEDNLCPKNLHQTSP